MGSPHLMLTKNRGTAIQMRDIYKLDGKKYVRITECGNLIKAEFIKNIRSFLAMAKENDRIYFYLISETGILLNTRRTSFYSNQILDFSVTADGAITAFEIENNNHKDIYLSYYVYSNRQSPVRDHREKIKLNKLVKITDDGKHKHGLFFSENNNLYFTVADNSNRSQVHCYNGSRINKITDHPIGCWYPYVKDNKLYYYTIGKGGFYLEETPIKDERNLRPIPFDRFESIQQTEFKEHKLQAKRTPRLLGMSPSYRYPSLRISLEEHPIGTGTNKVFIDLGFRVGGKNIQNDLFYYGQIYYKFYIKNFDYLFSLSRRFKRTYADIAFSKMYSLINQPPSYGFGIGMSQPYFSRMGIGIISYEYHLSTLDPRIKSGMTVYLFNSAASPARRSSFPITGFNFLVRTGGYHRLLGSETETYFIQGDIHFFKELFKRLHLHTRAAGAYAYGDPHYILNSINHLSPNTLKKKEISEIPGGLDLVSYFLRNSFYTRILGETDESKSFNKLFSSSLDLFLQIFDFYSVTRFFPWFMFQNITMDIFYDVLTFEEKWGQFAHGVGMAFDLRFSSQSKLNLGLSYQFNKKFTTGFYYFVNSVINY